MFKKLVAAGTVALTLAVSACSFDVNDSERGDNNAGSAGSAPTYSGVPQSLSDRMDSFAIVRSAKQGKVGVDAKFFALRGVTSLNGETEKFILDALKRGGAYDGRKEFTPVPTPSADRANVQSFINPPGQATADPVAPTSAKDGGNDEGAIKVKNDVVFAGGRYVVTRARAKVNGTKTVRLFVTDMEKDVTVPADKLFVDTPSDDDLDDLVYDQDAMPKYKGTEQVWDKLTDLGKDVSKSANTETVAKDGRVAADFSCALVPCVAITYDDGPSDDGLNEKLLDILKKEHVRATFFTIGQKVKRWPKETKKIWDAGHEVENHSLTHTSLDKLPAAGIEREIVETDKAIEAAGVPKPTMLRPPYGASNHVLDQVSKRYDKRIIRWDVDTLDWKTRSKSQTITNALATAHPGSIILMHSIHKSSVEATPEILDSLKEKGYSPVTVGDLYRGQKFDAGYEYFCRGYHLALCSTPEHPWVENHK